MSRKTFEETQNVKNAQTIDFISELNMSDCIKQGKQTPSKFKQSMITAQNKSISQLNENFDER